MIDRLTNDEINTLSIWNEPAEERLSLLKTYNYGKLYDSFVWSLMKLICPEDLFSVRKTDEQALASERFDGEAFAVALKEAVYRFDKTKSSFIIYFKRLYSQNKVKNFIAESDINITKEVVKLAKDVQLLYQKRGVSYSRIIDELKKDAAYRSYTEETWGKVYYYLEGGIAVSLKKGKSSYDGDDEGDELDFEDYKAENSFRFFGQTEDCINRLIINTERLTTAKELVFYKLYFTMLIMKALKGGSEAYIRVYPAGDEELYNLLAKFEVDLKEYVFNQDYIEYIIDDSPKDIKTLYGAYYNYQINPINKKSIAQFYGACSQANVTQAIKRILKKIDIKGVE